MSIVAKRLDGMPLGTDVGLGPGDIVLDLRTQLSPQKRSTEGALQPQIFGPCLLRANGRPSQQLLSSCSLIPGGAGAFVRRCGKINQLLIARFQCDIFAQKH